MIQRSKLYVKLEVPTIEPHTLDTSFKMCNSALKLEPMVHLYHYTLKVMHIQVEKE